MYSSTLSSTLALDGVWVVNVRPRPLYPRGKPGTNCIGGWVGPRPGLVGSENLALTGIRSADRPARSEWLYRLRCLGPLRYSYPITGLERP